MARDSLHTRRILIGGACLFLQCLLAGIASGWTTVGTGIEYQEFYLPDPNILFVTRMDRHNPECYIDTGTAKNRIDGALEVISSQFSRNDDAMSYWGQDWGHRNDVVVAINGDYWNTTTYIPLSGQIQTGWAIKNVASASYFGWTHFRDALAGTGALYNIRVRYSTGATQTISDINVDRPADKLIAYTNHYNANTQTDNTGVEVLVEMTRPMGVVPSTDSAVGYVRQIRVNQGSTTIPFDHVVLSATGTAATTLQNNVSVGSRISIDMSFFNYSGNWSRVYGSMGGLFLLSTAEASSAAADPMGGIIAPRTATAINSDYVYFIVNDGRSSISIGMDFNQLADFCRYTLGATLAISHDGGGSSCMVVNGTVVNDPSDGHERAVPASILMCVRKPKLQSTAFNSGDTVKTTTSTTIYSGPGSNYVTLGSISANNSGTIVDHSLRGIYAKGYYHWKVDFGSTSGWIRETNLSRTASSNLPVFTQHPTDVTTCPTSGMGTFSVAATGTGTLQYQWQHHGVNVTDGGHFSGTNTTSVTITDVSDEDAGAYRCVVTDDNGSTTSYSAALLLKAHTVIKKHPSPSVAYPLGEVTTASFTVTATGESPVTYQWQKGTVDLSNDGHYLGTNTATLGIVNVDSQDRGEYRCRVTGLCETAYSNPATLTVISSDLDGDGDGDLNDFGLFQNCLGISDPALNAPDCVNADLTGNDTIDSADRTAIKSCLSGPEIPLSPGC